MLGLELGLELGTLEGLEVVGLLLVGELVGEADDGDTFGLAVVGVVEEGLVVGELLGLAVLLVFSQLTSPVSESSN